MTSKLTTRGPAVAVAIHDRIPFETHGALCGTTSGAYNASGGRLEGPDFDRFKADYQSIDYAVWSYATPIAWHTPSGWHKVAQRFSVTTSKHQGKLYLMPAVSDRPIGV